MCIHVRKYVYVCTLPQSDTAIIPRGCQYGPSHIPLHSPHLSPLVVKVGRVPHI